MFNTILAVSTPRCLPSMLVIIYALLLPALQGTSGEAPTQIHFRQSGVVQCAFLYDRTRDCLTQSPRLSCWPDNIHYQMLKRLPESAQSTLLRLFNDLWQSGEFPKSWSDATVVPKPGKDPTSPNNYRPIALTSCVCKTFERMVNERLVWYLESNKILTEYQSGFRKHRSTTDQLVRLESYIREAFVRREHVVSVFFDLEKTYDTTWKYGILRDLHDAGLRGRMPEFIGKFLTDRSSHVRCVQSGNGSATGKHPIRNAVHSKNK